MTALSVPVGPKPGGPTHPTPTHPTPRLGEIVRDAERLCEQLVNILSRQIDPTSVHEDEVFDDGLRNVDAILGAAAGHVQAVVRELRRLPAYGAPVGSAVRVPRGVAPVGDFFLPGTFELAAEINAAMAAQKS